MQDERSAPQQLQCQHLNSKEIARGKWIALNEITYRDPTNKERQWEVVTRTTKAGSGVDAVVIIPVLKRSGQSDAVVMVKQYRPPVRSYTLEFPAGLIDDGENPVVCAMRELKEETGYVGEHKATTPAICLDPGLSDCTVNMVTLEIDGDAESNRSPHQQQEFIEVITTPQNELLKTLNKYAEEGIVVHSILYTYAFARAT